MKYMQVTVTSTSEFADCVANILTEHGSSGIVIKDYNDIKEMLKSGKNWDYVDDSLLNADLAVYIGGFFDENADVSLLIGEIESQKANQYFDTGSLEIDIQVLDSEDWENVWKKFYKPINCGHITIVPKWLKNNDETTIPVFIDPGMAFGTGNHETTSMCIELMQDAVVEGKSIIDMGCGSGILGICSSKLGAKEVLYTDIDSDAIAISKDNAAYNNCMKNAQFVCGDLAVDDKFSADVLIANLTADLLIKLYDKVAGLIKSGASAIISGIIDMYAQDVIDKYSEQFDIIKINKRNGWQAMLLTKK